MSQKNQKKQQSSPDLRRQDQLLEAVLPHVAFDGWSLKALEQGCRDLDDSLELSQQCFPAGVPDLVRHFGDWVNRQMLARLSCPDTVKGFPDMRVRDKIAAALDERLEVMAPHKQAVRSLQLYLAQPQHLPLMQSMLAEACDVMWVAAGDKSQDWNYYSKRLLLGGVYVVTIAYWLNDTSEHFSKTRAFLRRRIENVLKIGGTASKILSGLGTFKEGITTKTQKRAN